MSSQSNAQRPIGYWLKRADEVITQGVNQALSEYGMTRFHWQTLSLVQEAGQVNRSQLFEPMQTFVDMTRLDEIIAEFVQRGWMVRSQAHSPDDVRLELTEEGQRAHSQVSERQNQVRKRAMQGISEAEYATVLRVLQRVVENLTSDNEAR